MVTYTPTPTRGIDNETRKLYKRRRREVRFDGHMVVHRFSLFSEGRSPILRALRYCLCALKHFNRGVFSRDARSCDIMCIASTPPIQGAMAALVKKIRHIPLVYNLQDIFPDSLVGAGMTHKGSLLWKIGRIIEDFTYKNADRIIVISEDFKRNIMAKGVPEEKIALIYNWVDESFIVPVQDEENELFEEFGVCREKFRVVYAGNLGNAQNIELIVDAAKQMWQNNNKDIEFIIFGSGGLEEMIKERKEMEHLDNLKLFPLQPYERVAKVYGLGHVCVVACKTGLGGAAMPSKTWSIMSSGRAVLASFDEGELKNIIENNDCGIFTHAGNVAEFVNAIQMLSKDPGRCQRMGVNSRQFILKNLTKEVGTQKYVDVIKSFEKK